ncbi:MAG: hypothetical protein K8R76_10980 [Candidatus Aegiribacteria sp.]|nr:hypothetical protein [Candidatus Aegiribacteria sp.]
MKFMRISFAVIITFLIPVFFPAQRIEAGCEPVRISSLDSLASDISLLGYVPSGGNLPVLAAANNWFGLLSRVQLLPCDSRELNAIQEDTSGKWGYYGIADWSIGGDKVLVLAPPPRCSPLEIQSEVPVGSETGFILDGYETLRNPQAAIRTPGMQVTDLVPDSTGRFTFSAAEYGIYWVEIMEQTASGPSITLLFPVISGGTVTDVLMGDIPSAASDASCPEDILDEVNMLRENAGIPALHRESMLDSIAFIRAGALAFSGTSVHFSPLNSDLPDILPAGMETYGENIGRGAGYQEAWSMILISPFHLRTCMSPAYRNIGIAGAVDSGAYEWQLVMVQIFTSERNGL